MKTIPWLRAISCFAAFVCFSLVAFCQSNPRVTISGRVWDDSTGTPLQNVNVFVSQTTLGCTTDQSGRFEIKNVPLGSFEIVASILGYTVQSVRASITGPKAFDIRLHPISINLREVVVTADDPTEWRRQLSKFTKLFLGTTRNADECTLQNPEVLDFREVAGFFSATARKPLEIENRALGYHIQFILSVFKLEPENVAFDYVPSSILTWEGFQKYTDLNPSRPSDMKQWLENRKRAFKGSLRHFLISLVGKHLHDQEYAITTRPSLRENRFLDPKVTEDSIVVETSQPEMKIVRFNQFLEVQYQREYIESGYDLLKKKDSDFQISWIKLNYDAIRVNSQGLITEWFPTKLYGYWAWKRVADALPLDYEMQED
jgi:hypothetical protein